MKIGITVLLLTTYYCCLFGQTHPINTPGAKWGHYWVDVITPTPAYHNTSVEFAGFDTIGAIEYGVHRSLVNGNVVHFLRDSAGLVLSHSVTYDSLSNPVPSSYSFVLYNFNLGVGDTFPNGVNGKDMVVQSMSMDTMLDGSIRKVMLMDILTLGTTKWIEGIGDVQIGHFYQVSIPFGVRVFGCYGISNTPVFESGNNTISCHNLHSNGYPFTRPPLVIDSVAFTHPVCPNNNGTIQIFIDGGIPPFLYSINGTVNWQSTNSFSGLGVGLYDIVVQDSTGALKLTSVILTRQSTIVIDSLYITQATCIDSGSIAIAASGGIGPFQYSNDGGASFQHDSIFSGLLAGNYSIVIRDSAGCQTSKQQVLSAADTVDVRVMIGDFIDTLQISTVISALNLGMQYQWVDCDNAYAGLPGETGYSLVPLELGNYAVIITDTLTGCVDTSACLAVTTLGIISNSNNLQFEIYPNPTAGTCNLQFSNLESAMVTITNTLGQLVHSQTITDAQTTIDLDVEAGIYFVTVQTQQGSVVRKLVVE